MKKVSLCFIAILFLFSCRKIPGTIPLGKWKYKLLVNGVELGKATFENKIEDNRYVNTTEMQMEAGYVKNLSRQIITETMDFKPLKLEVYNRSINEGVTQEIRKVAIIKDDMVKLMVDKKKYNIRLKKAFIFDGNYFINELIKNKFKKGVKIKSNLYDPSVEIDDTIKATIKVIGIKKIEINGKEKELYHVVQAIENFKLIDFYIDGNGITQKASITMLNNRFELIFE
ncbi:hypothetical protein ACFL20_05185 [Spirochaetota bacterium]